MGDRATAAGATVVKAAAAMAVRVGGATAVAGSTRRAVSEMAGATAVAGAKAGASTVVVRLTAVSAMSLAVASPRRRWWTRAVAAIDGGEGGGHEGVGGEGGVGGARARRARATAAFEPSSPVRAGGRSVVASWFVQTSTELMHVVRTVLGSESMQFKIQDLNHVGDLKNACKYETTTQAHEKTTKTKSFT
jgi:hypothetical protein